LPIANCLLISLVWFSIVPVHALWPELFYNSLGMFIILTIELCILLMRPLVITHRLLRGSVRDRSKVSYVTSEHDDIRNPWVSANLEFYHGT
jgi:hypothetical protein